MPCPRSLVLAILVTLAALGGCRREAADAAPAPAGDTARAPSAPAQVAKPAAPVRPLASPRERIGTVMDRFLAARSYHAEMTTSSAKGDMTMQMDFVAPDRYRMKTPMGMQTVIGDSMYMTMNGRTMKMALPEGQVGTYRDPARLAEHKATMTAEALGSEAVDGQPAQKYRIRNTQPQPGESVMWVGADGYPLRIEVQGEAGGQVARTTIRYSRFNDPAIRIEPPQ